MQWIAVATPPFASIEQFDQVMSSMGQEPDGLWRGTSGATDDGLRVVTLWESKAHADRFFAETLGPALAKVLGPSRSASPRSSGSRSRAATSASRSADLPGGGGRRSGHRVPVSPHA